MKIAHHSHYKDQMSKIGTHHWEVDRLIRLSEGFKVFDACLDSIGLWHNFNIKTLRHMAGHVKAINDADLDCPIIIDEDGEIMDGRHRITKAILLGHKTIKAVRFDENPIPCKVDND